MNLSKETSRSHELREKTERVVKQFGRHVPHRSVILVGSVAVDSTDHFSDVDVIFYYDRTPNKRSIRIAGDALDLSDVAIHKTKRGVGFGMDFSFEGAAFNTGHHLVSFAEKTLSELLSGKNVDSIGHQKVAQGLLYGIPIYDDGTLSEWKVRLKQFPDPLAVTMADFYLKKIWPYWKVKEWVAARDASLFEVQALLDGAFNVIGALSAANRLYFSTFQFKRMRHHIREMKESPPGLPDRVEQLFEIPPENGAEELRKLVSETVEIVERLLPEVDTTQVRKLL